MALGAGVLVAAVSWAAFVSLGWSGATEVSKVIGLGLWLVPFASAEVVAFGYIVARRRMRAYSILTVAKGYGEVSLIYAFVQKGLGLLGAIQGALLVHLVVTSLLIAAVARDVGFSLPTFALSRAYVSFALPTVASALSGWVLAFSDRYVVRLFFNDAAVGIYNAAYSLGHLVNFVLPPLAMVLNPTIYSLWEKGHRERARGFQERTLKGLVLLAFPACFGLSYLGPAILHLLSTQEAAERGAIVVPLVAAAMVIYGTSIILTRVFTLNKDTKTVGLIWTIAAITNLLMNLALVPSMGVAGAAVATLASYFIALGAILIKGSKYSAEMACFPWSASAKSLTGCAVMVLLLHAIGKYVEWNLTTLVLGALAGATTYFIAIWALRVLSQDEMDFLREMIWDRGRT